jgi:hypothetical protein
VPVRALRSVVGDPEVQGEVGKAKVAAVGKPPGDGFRVTV